MNASLTISHNNEEYTKLFAFVYNAFSNSMAYVIGIVRMDLVKFYYVLLLGFSSLVYQSSFLCQSHN